MSEAVISYITGRSAAAWVKPLFFGRTDQLTDPRNLEKWRVISSDGGQDFLKRALCQREMPPAADGKTHIAWEMDSDHLAEPTSRQASAEMRPSAVRYAWRGTTWGMG
jgi:hypothetical protein